MRSRYCASVSYCPVVRIVLPSDRRRDIVALRIGQHAAMKVVAMRGDLDQARGLHLARLSPRYEVRARHDAIAVEHGTVRPPSLHPGADQGRHDRIAVYLDQGKDARIEALVAVIERDKDRLVGQRPHAARGRRHVVERDGVPASAFQPIEELSQRGRSHRIGLKLIGAIDDIVEGNRHEALAGRLAASVRDAWRPRQGPQAGKTDGAWS